MIADKDRSGWFGASDTSYIMGNWKTKTFAKWWLKKIGIDTSHFDNKYTLAGTYIEHRILESLDLNLELDKQILIPKLKLRINLDGNTADTIYECKTYKLENGFKVSKGYWRQVQVQMYGFEHKKAFIVAYGLTEKDYDNYFLAINEKRRSLHKIEYDIAFIEKYLVRLEYLAECLENGKFPKEEDFETFRTL